MRHENSCLRAYLEASAHRQLDSSQNPPPWIPKGEVRGQFIRARTLSLENIEANKLIDEEFN